MTTSLALETRIRDHYGDLSPSERKIGDLILELPGQIASYSGTELAELAGTSKATVTRLSHRLGYDSFEVMRRAARDRYGAGSPLGLLSRDPQPVAFSEQVGRHLQQDSTLLAQSLNGVDAATFTDSVAAICQAKRLYIAGWRNNQYLAGYLRWQIIQVRSQVLLLPGAGETLGESLADLTAGDMVIALGFRRRVPALLQTLEMAAEKSAKILYFTEQGAQSHSHVDWIVSCPIRGGDALDSYAGVMSLLHFYAMGVMDKMGAEGQKRLAQIEQTNEVLHEFG